MAITFEKETLSRLEGLTGMHYDDAAAIQTLRDDHVRNRDAINGLSTVVDGKADKWKRAKKVGVVAGAVIAVVGYVTAMVAGGAALYHKFFDKDTAKKVTINKETFSVGPYSFSAWNGINNTILDADLFLKTAPATLETLATLDEDVIATTKTLKDIGNYSVQQKVAKQNITDLVYSVNSILQIPAEELTADQVGQLKNASANLSKYNDKGTWSNYNILGEKQDLNDTIRDARRVDNGNAYIQKVQRAINLTDNEIKNLTKKNAMHPAIKPLAETKYLLEGKLKVLTNYNKQVQRQQSNITAHAGGYVAFPVDIPDLSDILDSAKETKKAADNAVVTWENTLQQSYNISKNQFNATFNATPLNKYITLDEKGRITDGNKTNGELREFAAVEFIRNNGGTYYKMIFHFANGSTSYKEFKTKEQIADAKATFGYTSKFK